MPQTYCSSFKETCTLKTQNLIPQKQKEKIHQHVHPASVTDACFRILDKKVSVIQPHRAYERKKKEEESLEAVGKMELLTSCLPLTEKKPKDARDKQVSPKMKKTS